jgi:hypothetical protein
MRLFGPLPLGLLALTAAVAVILVRVCRRRPAWRRPVRLALGCGLVVNELIWWRFRYAHEGVHLWNLPVQLCDVTLWMVCLPFFAFRAGLRDCSTYSNGSGGWRVFRAAALAFGSAIQRAAERATAWSAATAPCTALGRLVSAC